MFKRKAPRVIIDAPRDEPVGDPFASIRPQPITSQTGVGKKPHWFKTHKKRAIVCIVIGVLLLTGGTAAALYILTQKPVKTTATHSINTPPPEPPKYYSQLTGALVQDQATTTKAVTAIMIENSPDARPQSGIKDSGVVFEAIAEGGITRFLALYQEQKPQLIGPVRSVRMYYVDWAAAFNASIAHIGGSSAALAEVRNGSYRDIDQFFNAGAYWRATDRYAPHNVYTSFERLDALNASKGYTTSEFTGFSRKDSQAAPAPTEGDTSAPARASSISVTISGPAYNSAYTYNAATNTYDRSQGGAPHLDREAGQISPRVVVVLDVQQTTIFEDGYRESIAAIGSGAAHIFQDGTVQTATWKKDNKTAQLIFSDADGNDIPLARGQTWITAVPANRGGAVTWQ
jgi:hypothetical protein